MTHEYTLLVGATVVPDGVGPACEAIAWAAGTILALGSEAEIRAISRGDSCVLALPGLFVAPLHAPLEAGGPADMVVFATDPRPPQAEAGTGAEPGQHGRPGEGPGRRPIAVIRGGHIVEGSVEASAGDTSSTA